MRTFLKGIFSSCFGTMLGIIALILLLAFIGSRIASSIDSKPSIESNSVLHLEFNKPIPELTGNIESEQFSLKNDKNIGLQDYIRILNKAKEDKKIKGVLLDISEMQMSLATASTLRDAIINFKKSGKWVYATSKFYTQGSYFLSSAADQVYMHPMGGLDMRGLAYVGPYFTGMFEKLGIRMDVIYEGKYKSATEPFRLKKMSDENRYQMRELLGDWQRYFVNEISKSRNVTVDQLNSIMNGLQLKTGNDAVALKLIDGLKYKDELQQELRKKLGLKEDDKIPTVTDQSYYATLDKIDNTSKDKIAIVYAEGGIERGEKGNGVITDDQYVSTLSKIRKDKNVKAVVLRVNSPGGDALASESIWRECMMIKKSGKPVVVSMGDYAASGGYYISCMADSIYAHPNTLTGSIGVFMMMPNVRKLMNEKLGITFDTIQTNAHAASFNTIYDMTAEEKSFMQSSTDSIYHTFLKRVADGRHKSIEQIHEIAQGRVWTGQDAIGVGLVDRLGSLEDAIECAKRMAKCTQARTVEYPTVKEPFQQILDDISGDKKDDDVRIQSTLAKSLGTYYPWFQALTNMKKMEGVQARMPLIYTPLH